jgi:hypothetical protein
MKIGLVYDLRADWLARGYGEEETAEFDRGSTLDALEAALAELGHAVERVGGLFELSSRVAWQAAPAGSWSSTSPRACTASAARRRCPRCSTPIGCRTPSPIRCARR